MTFTKITLAPKPFVLGITYYTFLQTRDKMLQLSINIQYLDVKYMLVESVLINIVCLSPHQSVQTRHKP